MNKIKPVISRLSLAFGIIFLGAIHTLAQGQGDPPFPPMQGGVTSSGIPAGVVVPFAGAVSNIPPGWLLCDGSSVSGAQYPGLFSAIGEAHGEGDDGSGGDSFNLPDYRGTFLRGVDHTAGIDPDSGARLAMGIGGNTGNNVGSVQGDATALPDTAFEAGSAGSHSHTSGSAGDHGHNIDSSGGHSHTFSASQLGGARGDENGDPHFQAIATRTTNSAGNHVHSMSTTGDHAHTINSSTSHTHTMSGGDMETRPVNAYVNWIIKI